MAGRVVAVIDWRQAALLKENVGFLERAGIAGRIRPRGWRAGAGKHRSLTLFQDGTCEFQRGTVATVARRLTGRR